MAHINRRFIDKHWLVFMIRGALALVFGFLILFGGVNNIPLVISYISVILLMLGIADSFSALYNSSKKHGWITSIIDAGIDIITALILLFLSNGEIVFSLIVLSVYTFLSGVIDIFHGFYSTPDPTDRFIRSLTGICGCIMGIVILNSGNFEIMTFIRFFGAYLLIVGITSLIYGVHNRSQNIEDKIARKEVRKSSKTAKSSKKSK